MLNQTKYVVQGAAFVVIAMITFQAIKFIGSTKLFDSPSTQIDIDAPQVEIISSSDEGQKLFSENCASCHALHKRLIGPPLSNFADRGPWKDRKQLYKWVHNPEAYMKHNKYTKDLYKEYRVLMTPFPQMSNRDIDAIAEYMQSPIRMSY